MSPEEIKVFLESLGFFGPTFYILIVFICTVISPLSSVFLWPFVLLVWGFPLAVIYTTLGAIIGSTANFLIARKLGRPIIEKLISKKGMKMVDMISLKEGVRTLLILRLFPSALFDYVSYAAGLTKMRFVSYFFITSFFSLIWNLITFRFMDFFFILIGRRWYFVSGYFLVLVTILVAYFRVKRNETRQFS